MKKVIKWLVLILGLIIVLMIFAGMYKFNYLAKQKSYNVDGNKIKITSFFECMEAGNPVMESYPRQCRDGEDNLFVENIGNELDRIDLIRSDNPRPNQVITSPLTITGQAMGY